MSSHYIELDVRKGPGVPEVVETRVGEKGACVIVATVRSGGSLINLSGYTARFEMLKPDGTFVSDTQVEIDSSGQIYNRLHYTLCAEAAQVPGTAQVAYFALLKGDTVVETTDSFLVRIHPNAECASSSVSEHYHSELEEMLRQAEEQKARQQADYEEAEAAREEVFERRERARESAYNSRENRRDEQFAEAMGEYEEKYYEQENIRTKSHITAQSERVYSFDLEQEQRAEDFDAELAGYASQVDAAAFKAEQAADSLLERAEAGEFDGEQGPQGPKGDPGPQGPPGEDGADAAVMELPPGCFAMSVDERGHLIVTHNDNEPSPPLSIKDGRLVYTID